VKIRYPRINRAITAPAKYSIEELIAGDFIANIIIAVFIFNDLITIQKCNGIYKDFAKNAHRSIKT
jgi:hypothetical protein